MSIDLQNIRERVARANMLTDAVQIKERVLHRDLHFSYRVVLTALIKGDTKVREQILTELDEESFCGMFFGVVFDWVAHMLRCDMTVDPVELYEKTRTHTREWSLPEYVDLVEQVWDTQPASAETLTQTIACLQVRLSGEADPGGSTREVQQVILASLLKSDDEEQRRTLLGKLDPDYFEHLGLYAMFGWTQRLVKTGGKIEKRDLLREAELYVMERVLTTYTWVIDHLLAIETPDAETVSNAIALIQERYAWHLSRLHQFSRQKP